MLHASIHPHQNAIPVHCVSEAQWPSCREALSPLARGYAQAMGFAPKAGRILVAPTADGGMDCVLFGVGNDEGLAENPFLLAKLATDLPAGDYRLANALKRPEMAMIGFLLGGYRFEVFKANPAPHVRLAVPDDVDAQRISIIAKAVCFGRDLINRPANDLTTDALADATRALASEFSASLTEILGDDLLSQNFPLIHAVGRAGATPPRLMDLSWGQKTNPRVTLVGKGVVFDTGGLKSQAR